MGLKARWTVAAMVLPVMANLPTQSFAQQTDWSYEGSIYLFMPETDVSLDTPQGSLDGTLSFSDALENLDFAFMAAFAATNERWSIIADYSYTDLSFSNETSGPAFSGLETSFTVQYFSGYVGYRVFTDQSAKIDLVGGFRWFRTETEFDLQAGTAPGRTTNVDESWTDPVIGARARVAFSDRWSGTGFIDYGGFRSDSETWQVLLTADYAINDRWLLRGGYRYISFDHDIDGNDFKFDQSGPVFGATYRF